MKNIIIKLLIIGSLILINTKIFAASAFCSAQNNRTGQFFSATGEGPTQASATRDAQNNVKLDCNQGASNNSNECEIGNCSSYEY